MNIDPIALQIELRKKDWSLKKLAKETLLSYQTIKLVNRGVHCSKETAEVIALVLDVPLKTLSEGTNYVKDVKKCEC